MSDANKKMIRNSTAEFLIFTSQSGESSIEARYEEGTIWLSQKLMATLFDVEENTITYHLKEIYKSNEIEKNRTTRNFRVVQQEGSRTVTAITKHLKNIFESGELEENVVSSILEHTTIHGALEGKTQEKKVKYYNLDTIISVGYRVNSAYHTIQNH